jgi:transposase-like protein
MDQDTLRFLLETTFGQVDLKVPRDREGQYYPAFLKPYACRLVDVGGQPKATFRWP